MSKRKRGQRNYAEPEEVVSAPTHKPSRFWFGKEWSRHLRVRVQNEVFIVSDRLRGVDWEIIRGVDGNLEIVTQPDDDPYPGASSRALHAVQTYQQEHNL